MKFRWYLWLIGGRPPPSQTFTSPSIEAPVLDPMRILVGAGGVLTPASLIRTSSRCSMYVSGVVSGSMFTFIVRAGSRQSVPAPSFHVSESAGTFAAVASRAFASTDRKRPA